jgi:hypothetical protein
VYGCIDVTRCVGPKAGLKLRHRLQMKLRSAVLFYLSGYGPPPARPTVLETDTSALPIQSFLPMSRISCGDQPQLPLIRSLNLPVHRWSTRHPLTVKNLNPLRSIIGKFALGPTSVREFGPTASLNDRFAPKAPFEVLRSNFRCTPESRLNSEIGQCPRSARNGSRGERRGQESELLRLGPDHDTDARALEI